MIDRRWTEKKDYKGGELYRLRAHHEMADWDTSIYLVDIATHGSCLSHSLKFFLLHSAVQLVLYSLYTGALFNCCTSGFPHDAANICIVTIS